MAKNFYDRDMGYAKLMTKFEVEAGKASVFCGYLRSSGVYKPKAEVGAKPAQPITVAQLGAVHEFGSRDKKVPERSHIRSAIDGNKRSLQSLIEKLAWMVLDGKKTRKQALGIIGEKVISLIKAKIRSKIPPPLRPSTIARKGASKRTPLIDTAQMINSLDWEVHDGKVVSASGKKTG